MQNRAWVRLLQRWLTTDRSPSAFVQDNENEDWSTTLPKKGWLADCVYTYQIDIQESTLSAQNRSLGLESTSSVVNERLLIPQVHQLKIKGKTILTTSENSSGEVQKIDHAPTRLLVDRSTSSTDPPDPFLTFGHHSTTERFWNLRLLNLFE